MIVIVVIRKRTMTIMLLSVVCIATMLGTSATFAEQSSQTGEQSDQKQKQDIQVQNSTSQKAMVDELTKQEFKNDIKELISDLDAEQFQAKSDEIKAEYDEFFEAVIEQARLSSGTRMLIDNEITGAKEYIFSETIKDEKHKALQGQDAADRIDVSFLEWLGVKIANAACASTTNPNYKQLRIDIDGGTYGGYTFNGGNDLYSLSYKDNSRTCERTYTLYFHDEDHPYLDGFYDNLRLILYERVQDIEIFTIKNNNQIEFDSKGEGSWSSSNDFDCLNFLLIGCHDTTTKSYVAGQTIYVSNTWNHMMDTSDTNPQHSKVTVP